MKDYVKEGQKMPLYGVGPFIVFGMAVITLVGIILFCYVLKTGTLSGPWTVIFRIFGTMLTVCGVTIWYTAALRSDMDDNIAENRLKTDGIYAWVRNPMYSGFWIAFFGISLFWHNICLLIIPVINWIFMTVILRNTEEKWLLELYGNEYRRYLREVNRCLPRIRRKGLKDKAVIK